MAETSPFLLLFFGPGNEASMSHTYMLAGSNKIVCGTVHAKLAKIWTHWLDTLFMAYVNFFARIQQK